MARDKKKAKILYWRDAGFAMWHFRVESDLFDLGRPRFGGKMQISWRDLARLLEGYNIFEGKSHRKIPPKWLS